jgi:23S rRNA pseudouridine1911/1915/1917 synthase
MRKRLSDIAIALPQGATPRPLDRVLRESYPGASWAQARELVRSGKVRVSGAVVSEPSRLVAGGDRITVTMHSPHATREKRLHRSAIIHVDAQIVVVSKPAGISTVPYESERDTLDELVQSLLRRLPDVPRSQAPLEVVHRLDKETSGLVVFARSLAAKRQLKQQFRVHSVHRRYLALVHGALGSRTFRSRLVTDRGDGLRGSTSNPKLGQTAVTHVRPRETLVGATLVECRLETGRTHQIRIQLSESGHPIVGERVYVRGYTDPLIAAPRLMLHAAELGFLHPTSGRPLRFSEALPADMQAVLERLRKESRTR